MAATFTLDDIRLLEKTIEIRERLVNNLFDGVKDLPTKPREIDCATNLLESIDRSIFAKAKIKIDDSNSAVNAETKEVLKDLLLNLHKNSNNQAREMNAQTPEFVSQGTVVKEGELIPKIDNADVSKFLPT